MLFFFFIASAYKAYATPIPLGSEVFSSTPFTFLFARSPCICGPQERTLFEVIRSCVLTIFACVYTSLHPNVPNPKASKWQKILGRLKISFYMLIAPEAVIWWAMRQWYGARSVAEFVNTVKPGLQWTTTHGHFVQMGGLQRLFPDGHREVISPEVIGIATAMGVIDYTELQFPKEQVEDRSKGDFLSKGLVILQTSWFILECIARFRQHLPITELEIVTLAFAILNIITYGFWWDKPLNVNCQVVIHFRDGSTVHEEELQETPGGSNPSQDTHGDDIELRDIAANVPPESTHSHAGEDGNQDATSSLAPNDTKENVGTWRQLLIRPFLALVLPIRDLFLCQKIEEGAGHVPMFYAFLVNPTNTLRIRVITCLIGMIFGGIHCLAWDSHFPTHIELVLWRSSSLIIVIIPFLVGLFGILAGKWYYELTWEPNPDYANPNPMVKIVAMVLYTLGPVLYILARISLVVQAFLSLRDLPPGVFETVTWTSYLPHL